MKKDVGWLRYKLETLRDADRSVMRKNKLNSGERHRLFGSLMAYEEALNFLGQLDEPEVLSQKLPVIPKYMADFLEKAKVDTNLMRVMDIAYNYKEVDEFGKHYHWIRENHELFAEAWLDGYTVEEEQKYIVKLPMSKNNNNQYAIVDYSGNIWVGALPSKYKLTEEEIRGLTKGDVLFEHFAVKVEEVAE